MDQGEPCGQAFQRLEVAGLQGDLLQRIHRHRLRVLVPERLARPERPLPERERRLEVQPVRVDDREAAERAHLALGVAERRRGLERRLQVRDRHPVVGRPGEHEAQIVVRAHRDLGRHLRLGEHPLQIVPRARDVTRPRPDPRTRQEPFGDVTVGRRPPEFGRELDRRGEVREGLVARVQAFGPFGGEVVPSTGRLQVAGASVMVREEAEVLVDPLRPQLLDRRGGGRVELAAPALQQRPVRDLLDQRVREPHLVGLTVAFEQAGAHQLVRLGAGIGSDQTLEQGQVDRTTQHRRGGEHVARSRRERVEPSQDHLLDRRRQLDARAVGRDPRGPLADEGAGSDERADQLRQVEGIAAGGLDDASEQLLGDLAALEQRDDELVDPIVREGLEVDHLGAVRRRRRSGRRPPHGRLEPSGRTGARSPDPPAGAAAARRASTRRPSGDPRSR